MWPRSKSFRINWMILLYSESCTVSHAWGLRIHLFLQHSTGSDTNTVLCSKTNLCLLLQWPVKSCSQPRGDFHLTPAYDKLCLNWFKQIGLSVTYMCPELPWRRVLNNASLEQCMEMTLNDNVLKNVKQIRRSPETKWTWGGVVVVYIHHCVRHTDQLEYSRWTHDWDRWEHSLCDCRYGC